MKKILGIVFLTLIMFNPVKSGIYGEGKLKLSDNIVRYFMQYIKGGNGKYPSDFYITTDGMDATYWTCIAQSNCKPGSVKIDKISCEQQTGKPCEKFARKRQIKWKNGINPGKGKVSTISSKLDINELKVKLTELGFYGNSASSANTTTPKITKKKKEVKKVVKKYELKGERSIALSWEGYEDLIAGTVNFDETDYKGTLNLPLPNNDGTCDGTYSLQKGGKGTWQIACSNNMGAAGTLKWVKDGGVTGTGRDHNDKKVKFTVSKNS